MAQTMYAHMNKLIKDQLKTLKKKGGAQWNESLVRTGKNQEGSRWL
jgi:hypothetical protein